MSSICEGILMPGAGLEPAQRTRSGAGWPAPAQHWSHEPLRRRHRASAPWPQGPRHMLGDGLVAVGPIAAQIVARIAQAQR